VKYHVRIGDDELEVVLDGDEVAIDGIRSRARLADVEGTPVRMLTVGDEVHRIVVRAGDRRGRYTIWVDGFRHEVEALDERTRAIRELAGASSAPAGPSPLLAPMPGMIVRVQVQAGDMVQPGQGLVVMEAMKMENELRASSAARVKTVLAQPGSAVEKGALLIELE
jgi:acetyl/propionyl-CoA carboxylase alpha subunit